MMRYVGGLGASCPFKRTLVLTPAPDILARTHFLRNLQTLQAAGTGALEAVEQGIDMIADLNQHALAGLLSYYVGMTVLETSKSTRLAGGFIRAASISYRKVHLAGVNEMLRQKFPEICTIVPVHGLLPSQALGANKMDGPKELSHRDSLHRDSLSTSNGTLLSPPLHASETSHPEKAVSKISDDQLDTLT